MNCKIYNARLTLLISIVCLTVSFTQAQLKVQSGATISCTGGAVITLNNTDLDNDGAISLAAGQGTIIFNGNSNNSISGISVPLFDKLQIAKTGNAKLILQQGIEIGSAINFISGIIDLNAQHILLQPDALLDGESETSYLTGTNGGYVQITSVLNAPSSANPGNLGAVISSAANLGNTVISRGHVSQTNASGAGNSILRYYDITPANNVSLNATLQLNYFDAELNGLDENSLVLWKSTDNINWSSQGNDTRNTTNNYVSKTGLNDFSRWTLSSPGNPLPLKWVSFNTRCINGGTRITWKTQEEQNTASFVVRRSTDGFSWTAIGTISAAGNSQAISSYSYTDPQSPSATSYYQIMQRDLDGSQSYSPVLISRCGQPESIKVYPNPVQTNCWVSIQSETAGAATLRLYDSRGALMYGKTVAVQTGNNQFALLLNGLPTGNYVLVITWSDGKVKVVKIEKN
ncbi:T9SS type A sorting domain-containing protein [Pseudobacter ginsenosidimutans]|uniref:Putative secreted protein (Por secretion system target) n=1 Tax=Pseudobacter ginsenosidimutans TaxID=661488 RepID=A0A4Q7N4X0_9BACT|nr:T9SS type A sorting domain-containing protein [Pseudobacter ginsenosidimutans]QEC44587.1 T9SS type A sorting domain-containing protein [Pseudobacter ginsenosidimutans]RZS76066.1 putative secreted protein (Por secretion system target) [Pseudobacter ginsenosidimutans]